eukprot:1153133-Pelagomonas_calceolata.AAC.7
MCTFPFPAIPLGRLQGDIEIMLLACRLTAGQEGAEQTHQVADRDGKDAAGRAGLAAEYNFPVLILFACQLASCRAHTPGLLTEPAKVQLARQAYIAAEHS